MRRATRWSALFGGALFSASPTQSGFRMIGMVLIIHFRSGAGDHVGDRRSLRDRRSRRHLLLYRSGIGIRNGTGSGM